jgi:hypothetical protein
VLHHDALCESAWCAMMSNEFLVLCHTNTWVLVPQSHGFNIVDNK